MKMHGKTSQPRPLNGSYNTINKTQARQHDSYTRKRIYLQAAKEERERVLIPTLKCDTDNGWRTGPRLFCSFWEEGTIMRNCKKSSGHRTECGNSVILKRISRFPSVTLSPRISLNLLSTTSSMPKWDQPECIAKLSREDFVTLAKYRGTLT
jgi:hypothetical protein